MNESAFYKQDLQQITTANCCKFMVLHKFKFIDSMKLDRLILSDKMKN